MTLPDNTSKTLIVPAQVDALVVNQQISNAGDTWNRWQMDYEQLNKFANPMPAPFTGQLPDPPDVGIHVHWALPDGLTHGSETPAATDDEASGPGQDKPPAGYGGETPSGSGDTGAGDIVYPFLPNRWLVLRIITVASAPTAPPVVSAWVIESDALNTVDGAPFLDPTYDATATKPVEPMKLGTSMTLADWQAKGGDSGGPTTPPFLTALAPGNLTFVGFAPGNNNVLSFHDPLTGIDEGTLSYQVFGWYSDPTADPLNKRTAKDGWVASVDPEGNQVMIAAGLDWSVPVPEGGTPPTVTAIAGLIHDVAWNRTKPIVDPVNYPTNISEKVRVSVGATAADALGALIREQAIAAGVSAQEASQEADLLEAFLTELLGTLDSPGGTEALSRKLHDAAFSKQPGGYTWRIAPVQKAGADTPPPLTQAQLQWLAQLNTDQADLDLQARILDSMSRELANLWWKNERIKYVPPPQGESANFQNAVTNLPKQVDPSNSDGWYAKTAAQKTVVSQAKAKVPTPAGPGSAESIEEFSKGMLDPAHYELKPSPAPRFAAPTDPVMLITGLGRSERFGSDGVLACRLPDHLITGLKVHGQDLTTATMPAGTVPQLDVTALPPLADPLLSEAFWLSPQDAAVIADKGLNSTDQTIIAEIRTNLTAQPPADVIGTPPAAIANQEWSQPWLPLYLEWSVNFLFTFVSNGKGGFKTDPKGDYLFDRTAWTFDGTHYGWAGNAPDPQSQLTYTGRTFLTPHGSFTFLQRLQDYLSKNPNADLQNVEQILEKLSKFDVLSQTLSGLTSQLAMIDPNPNVAPPDAMSDVIGAGDEKGVPYLGAVQDQDRRFGAGSPFFFPIRAGFLEFVNLRITDSFGHTLSLMEANGNPSGDAATFKPIQGRGMAPDANEVGKGDPARMLRLEPRLAQPARLTFSWISSEDDNAPVETTAGANPVCGWLLPNHLDNSLAVYTAGGKYLGEVLTVFIASGQDRIAWIPAPGDPTKAPVVDPNATPEIPNAHLAAIVNRLLGHPDGPVALGNFLQVIDETLWTVEPVGTASDQDLATIIGRPIAVTRVNLALDLFGQAQVNQAFFKTFVSVTETNSDTLLQDAGSLEQFTWPVRMGSQVLRGDGTIGYFLDDDYDSFNAVHVPDSLAPASTSYVQKIGAGNYVDLPVLPEAPDDGPIPPTPKSRYLTLLLDPSGSVNAATGLLPSLEVWLDSSFVDEARDTMALTFRAGPLLLDPDTVRIPTPSINSGQWNWLQPTGTGVGDWQTDPVADAGTTPQMGEAPSILREGWLRFTPDRT